MFDYDPGLYCHSLSHQPQDCAFKMGPYGYFVEPFWEQTYSPNTNQSQTIGDISSVNNPKCNRINVFNVLLFLFILVTEGKLKLVIMIITRRSS